jgi:hypothetical protein
MFHFRMGLGRAAGKVRPTTALAAETLLRLPPETGFSSVSSDWLVAMPVAP